MLAVAEARKAHIATAEVNRFLERVTRRNPPPEPGENMRCGSSTGPRSRPRPPRFVIFTNTATTFHFSYERFLVNQLREAFGFAGTPIRLQVRSRRG